MDAIDDQYIKLEEDLYVVRNCLKRGEAYSRLLLRFQIRELDMVEYPNSDEWKPLALYILNGMYSIIILLEFHQGISLCA